MTDGEIVDRLRSEHSRLSAAELGGLLNELLGGDLDAAAFISYFKDAFPHIPLRVLVAAAGRWRPLGGGEGTDDELNQLLGPYLLSDRA